MPTVRPASDDFDRTRRRDERSSTQYSHYMLKVTPASLASVVRENVWQDAWRLIIDNRQCCCRPDASLRGLLRARRSRNREENRNESSEP